MTAMSIPMYNPSRDNLPVGEEFTLATATLRQRVGFDTITDPALWESERLPRWVLSYAIYRIHEGGTVWGRQPCQGRLSKKYNSVPELIEAWEREQKAYLSMYKYTRPLTEVYD
jgi:hypothetical protein